MSKYSYNFAVNGMHCDACAIAIPAILQQQIGVVNATADLNKRKALVEMDREITSSDLLTWNKELQDLGYSLIAGETQQQLLKYPGRYYIYAISLAVIVLLGLSIMMGQPWAQTIQADALSLPGAFLIGVVASISTCMATVGGVVLAVSSNTNHKWRTLLSFHSARLFSFFLLGGVLGLIGSWFTYTAFTNLILNLILGIGLGGYALSMLGLNLPWQGVFPKLNLVKHQHGGTLMSVIIGAATFFLPCGFTQSMQFAALGSANVITAAGTMLAFAIGTLPVLVGLSLIAKKFVMNKHAVWLIIAVGIILLGFAINNLIAAMRLAQAFI